MLTEATVFFLVRHALCDPVGVSIAGRTGGVPLNGTGRLQADSLAERLHGVKLHALYSSPLDTDRGTKRQAISSKLCQSTVWSDGGPAGTNH